MVRPVCRLRGAEKIVDLRNLQATGEWLSQKCLRWMINFTQVYNFQICSYLNNFFGLRFNINSLHISQKLARQCWSVDDMGECWLNVIKTFEQKRHWYGVQSAGGRFGAFYYSMQLCDCNWMKGVKNCKWCLSSTVLCLQFVLIYASSNYCSSCVEINPLALLALLSECSDCLGDIDDGFAIAHPVWRSILWLYLRCWVNVQIVLGT